jgi:hypothetical protein
MYKQLRLLYGYLGKWYGWIRVPETKVKAQLMSADRITVEHSFTILPADQRSYVLDHRQQSPDHNCMDVVPILGKNVGYTSSIITFINALIAITTTTSTTGSVSVRNLCLIIQNETEDVLSGFQIKLIE